MSTTYPAVLRDDRLEWRTEAPPHLIPGTAINVQVTIPDESATQPSSQGQRMADALEQIAQQGTFAGTDVAGWERQVRADRPLPGREE